MGKTHILYDIRDMRMKGMMAGFGFCMAMMSMPSCTSHNEEELYPDQPCDTLQVTYSSSIVPIINLHCLACHSAVAPSSGIPLEGYDHLKAMVDAERLVGSVRHVSGFSAMPQNAPKLPECDLDKIEIWVNQGAPDN